MTIDHRRPDIRMTDVLSDRNDIDASSDHAARRGMLQRVDRHVLQLRGRDRRSEALRNGIPREHLARFRISGQHVKQSDELFAQRDFPRPE